MVNMAGNLVSVLPEHVDDAVRRGLRPATDSDFTAASAKKSNFAMRFVGNLERGSVGSPIVVRGAGPSVNALCEGRSIYVNPRASAFRGGYALALDNAYWKGHEWAGVQAKADGCFAPEYGCANAPDGCHLFGLPVVAAKGGGNRLEMRVRDAIHNCHISAVAALLVARYLTRRPVILTGCDLSGSDGARPYAERQLPIFERSLPLIDNVFAHKEMGGPLRDLLPTWRGI
jgi:hypothetical protein